MNLKLKILISFLLTYNLFCFLSLNRHSSGKTFTYHSELWADKAGYNVYLPGFFIYDFNASNFPKHIEKNTGYGFSLDSASNKVITKYPYGVALLQCPFWLTAHLLSSEKNGYSLFYQKSIDFAGSFYLTSGLFLLFFMIRNYRTKEEAAFFSLAIILSSGIFYYGIFETGMSHIYSFFCLSAILYFILNNAGKQQHYQLFIIFIFSIIFIIIRPLNVVFLGLILAFFLYNKTIIITENFIKLKNIIALAFISLLLLLPQLLYYHYAFGSWFTNSYKNEPFIFPSITRITELLFGPNNGLILYYPVLIFLIIYFLWAKNSFNKFNLSLLITYILIYASWWSLSLGCGFGHRAINDIFPIFFIPLILNHKPIHKSMYFIIVFCVLINVKFIFSYDTCLHNSLNWKYLEYKSILFGEFK